MTNLAITTTANTLSVAYNDLAATAGLSSITLRADCIAAVFVDTGGVVRALLSGTASITGMGLSVVPLPGALLVDTLNGVAPADNAALETALAALMG